MSKSRPSAPPRVFGISEFQTGVLYVSVLALQSLVPCKKRQSIMLLQFY